MCREFAGILIDSARKGGTLSPPIWPKSQKHPMFTELCAGGRFMTEKREKSPLRMNRSWSNRKARGGCLRGPKVMLAQQLPQYPPVFPRCLSHAMEVPPTAFQQVG